MYSLLSVCIENHNILDCEAMVETHEMVSSVISGGRPRIFSGQEREKKLKLQELAILTLTARAATSSDIALPRNDRFFYSLFASPPHMYN